MLLKLSAAALGLALTAGAACADDLVAYSQAGVWSILVDTTLGNGCFMTADFEDGSTVRIGFDRLKGNGYLAAFNTNWGDITDGTVYPVSFMLDDKPYDGEGNGLHLNDVPGVLITFDNVDFLDDISKQTTLTLQHDGADVMSIDLSDSGAATAEIVACQNVQG